MQKIRNVFHHLEGKDEVKPQQQQQQQQQYQQSQSQQYSGQPVYGKSITGYGPSGEPIYDNNNMNNGNTPNTGSNTANYGNTNDPTMAAYGGQSQVPDSQKLSQMNLGGAPSGQPPAQYAPDIQPSSVAPNAPTSATDSPFQDNEFPWQRPPPQQLLPKHTPTSPTSAGGGMAGGADSANQYGNNTSTSPRAGGALAGAAVGAGAAGLAGNGPTGSSSSTGIAGGTANNAGSGTGPGAGQSAQGAGYGSQSTSGPYGSSGVGAGYGNQQSPSGTYGGGSQPGFTAGDHAINKAAVALGAAGVGAGGLAAYRAHEQSLANNNVNDPNRSTGYNGSQPGLFQGDQKVPDNILTPTGANASQYDSVSAQQPGMATTDPIQANSAYNTSSQPGYGNQSFGPGDYNSQAGSYGNQASTQTGYNSSQTGQYGSQQPAQMGLGQGSVARTAATVGAAAGLKAAAGYGALSAAGHDNSPYGSHINNTSGQAYNSSMGGGQPSPGPYGTGLHSQSYQNQTLPASNGAGLPSSIGSQQTSTYGDNTSSYPQSGSVGSQFSDTGGPMTQQQRGEKNRELKSGYTGGPAVFRFMDSIGLGQYSSLLTEAWVDMTELRNLSEDELISMGLPLGACLKIKRALHRYNDY